MTTLIVTKNGVVKIRGNGEVKEDGTVRIMGNAIVVIELCKKYGLDPKVVQRNQGPALGLARMGMNDGCVEVLTEDDYNAKQKAITEMRELERRVINESDRYRTQFNRMMEDEYNDGVNPPKPEDRSIWERLAEMKKVNPRAALYLKAERQAQGTTSYSATSGQMKGGTDAMQILRDGGSIEDAEKALSFRYDTDNWN